MVLLTSKQREKLVLDLYNEGKTIKEIAKEAKMSFRDIGAILKEAGKQQEQAQMQSIPSQAYQLFSEGKTVLQVAIALNLREYEAIRLYREYWNLRELDSLNALYEEVKGDIWPLVNLHASIKAAGMSVEHVIRLLKISNNDLPAVEDRYESLKREVRKLEGDKTNATMLLQDLSNQISLMRNILDSIRLECQKEEKQMHQLYQKNMKLEALVRQFQNDNEEYLKITKTVEQKVTDVLSAIKPLLQLALFSITESMRDDPDKYSSLIYYNNNDNRRQQYYPSHDSYIETCKAMLIEEAEKLYTTMSKRVVDEVIDEYIPALKRSAQFERLSAVRIKVIVNSVIRKIEYID